MSMTDDVLLDRFAAAYSAWDRTKLSAPFAEQSRQLDEICELQREIMDRGLFLDPRAAGLPGIV